MRPIPVIPITVAIPVWFGPMIGSPKAMKYAPIRHVAIPRIEMMLFHFFNIFPPFFIYHILLCISNFMLDIANIRYLRLPVNPYKTKNKYQNFLKNETEYSFFY